VQIRKLLALAGLALGATCGGGATENGSDGGPDTVAPITISINPSVIVAPQGRTVTAAVTFTRTANSTDAVTLSARGLSDGVTATFNPASFTSHTGASQLVITTAATAPPRTDTLLIDARGPASASNPEGGTIGANLLVTLPSVGVSKIGTGSGTITSMPAGITCGGTCSGSFAYGTPITLTAAPSQSSVFAGWSGACSGTTPTCELTAGGTQGVAIATFNSTTPSFSLAVAPTTVAVAQGGNSSATVTLTRNNGFAGAVNLAVTGAPQGLTVTPNPASITGTTSSLTIAPSLALASGSYPVTITAAGNGVAQQTATLGVQVTPGQGGSGNVAMSFAACDPSTVPIWFAVQAGNGAWTRVTAGANNTYIFTPGATGGLAYVIPDATGAKSTQVLYGTAAEITAVAAGPGPCSNPQTGTKRVNGTATRFGSRVTVLIGGADTTWNAVNGPSYSLFNAPAGKRDLVAVVPGTFGNGDPALQRMIIRRNVEYANNATAPPLDFGVESFAPVQHFLTLSNLTGDQSAAEVVFATTNGEFNYFSNAGHFFAGIGTDGIVTYGIPDSLLQSGDFQIASVFATASDGRSFRGVQSMVHSVADRTVTFGPALATPSVTTIGASPYLRLRVQLPLQNAYNAAVSGEYTQGGNGMSISATAGYFTGTQASWIIDVPDLTSAGYDPAWGLKAGATLSWEVSAVGGNVLPFAGALGVDGAQILVAGTSNDAAAFSVAARRTQGWYRPARSIGKPFPRF